MTHCNTVLSQMLNMIPRHEFEKLAYSVDGKVRSTALSRWSQFVALTVGQLNGRKSLRDIESCLSAQQHLNYHLGTQVVSRLWLEQMNIVTPCFTHVCSRCCINTVATMRCAMGSALKTSCFH